MNESDRSRDVAVLLILLIIMGCSIVYSLLDYSMRKPPDFKHLVDDHTVVTVNPRDCWFFGIRNRETALSLDYTEKGVERSVSSLTHNLTTDSGVKACVTSFTASASKFSKIAKPLNVKSGFSAKGIHSRFEIETKDNTPMATAYYRQGTKINTLTFPVEACVNPQFDGPVTFAHDGKSFDNTTVFALERQELQLTLLTDACEVLSGFDVS